ncbi:MAG: DUF4466 family protein [Dysgonamonadaceae bacterium]|jgi:hypothetical protein|nr:DUF4466 family protein [Dysgonamonadaceae bacterium]
MKTISILLLTAVCFFISCSDDNESLLKNDLIKKTMAPAIAGEKIDFAYAIGTLSGKLATAQAEASIAGAAGTGFEWYSYYTASNEITVDGTRYPGGSEVPVKSVKETSTSGAVSTATLEDKIDEVYMNPSVPHGTRMVDLIAVTLRYSYIVPAEAKGQKVSFVFSAKSSTGESVSYKTPEYNVSKMDMKRLIPLTTANVCYFSIENMAAYTLAEVNSQNLSDKIDFIYIHQAKLDNFDYGHAFVSPGTDPKYIATPNVIPGNWTKNSTRMEKRADVRDAQLKGSIPNVYIDDIDFQTLQLDQAYDFVLNFAADEGAFMKTANGKYAAYVYINRLATGTVTVSIKRYPL